MVFHGASFHGSVFNLSCAVVGSGIMSLPATLKVLGLFPGVALIHSDVAEILQAWSSLFFKEHVKLSLILKV